MVERIVDLPGGAIGFRVSGKISRDEYHEMLRPVHEALERGEKVSFLIAADPEFSGLDLAALWEDAKNAGSIGLKQRSSWHRTAVVTDKDWMRHAISGFGWMMPGEVRVFEPDELDKAKAWVGESAAP
jgi:SpoIIAA-like